MIMVGPLYRLVFPGTCSIVTLHTYCCFETNSKAVIVISNAVWLGIRVKLLDSDSNTSHSTLYLSDSAPGLMSHDNWIVREV